MKLVEIPAPDFDVAMTLDSGQVFHWEKIDNGFVGAIADYAVYLEQHGDVLKVKMGGGAPARPSSQRAFRRRSQELDPAVVELVKNYFALDHPLTKICSSFPNDPAMNAARKFCRGLRIIRQPKWECLATFICSSMKQVAHIRQISKALRERFGVPRRIVHHVAHTFPSARRLAESSENELRKCALGYRSKNLLGTARLVASGEVDLDAWSTLSDDDLREKLCALPGVGAKVANCVMLFAYERLRAFPIDVWIERVLREKYFLRKRNATLHRLREFSETYFGEHRGYAQQYLFHYARATSRKSQAVKVSSATLRSARNEKKGRREQLYGSQSTRRFLYSESFPGPGRKERRPRMSGSKSKRAKSRNRSRTGG
jgi:N-glycosylase/DNA lyase